MRTDPLDLGPEVRFEIGECVKGEIDVDPCRLGDRSADRRIVEGQHAAAGVFDDDDLLGSEEVLADHERSDRVIRSQATRVPDDVGVAGPEPQDILDGQTRVHAREDGESPSGWEGKIRAVELRRVACVLGQRAIKLGCG